MKSQVAILKKENKRITALFVDNKCKRLFVDPLENENDMEMGNVYVGRVQNYVDNIKSYFVEIKPGLMCYMAAKDTLGQRMNRGDEIVVQLCKEAMKTKLASVTMKLTLNGKHMVLLCDQPVCKISRKITKDELQSQLREMAKTWMEEKHHGVLFRTSAKDVSPETLENEYNELVDTYEEISSKGKSRVAFTCLHKATPFYLAFAREQLEKGVEKVSIEEEDVYHNLCQLIPAKKELIEWYQDDYSLDSLLGISTLIERCLSKKVWLNSGGSLVIEPTEALVSIDVNTEKAISGKRNPESTFFKVNMEAADEIARQLALRNLSGIIIVDFIDMKDEEHRNELFAHFRSLLKEDPVKTVLIDMTELGLVEVTRMKKRKPLYEEFKA